MVCALHIPSYTWKSYDWRKAAATLLCSWNIMFEVRQNLSSAVVADLQAWILLFAIIKNIVCWYAGSRLNQVIKMPFSSGGIKQSRCIWSTNHFIRARSLYQVTILYKATKVIFSTSWSSHKHINRWYWRNYLSSTNGSTKCVTPFHLQYSTHQKLMCGDHKFD